MTRCSPNVRSRDRRSACSRSQSRTGVKICRLFGLGADEFFYKWEAQTLDMSRRTALGAEASRPPFTLAAARELKDAIQREREKQAAAAARTGVLNALSAPRGRGRGAAGILGIGRLPTSHLGTPVKSEPGLATGLGSPLPARHKAVAGPSRVKFDGPPMTSDARNGRACAWLWVASLRSVDRDQTGTCTRRSPLAANVSYRLPRREATFITHW
jgi:hypothetical protein